MTQSTEICVNKNNESERDTQLKDAENLQAIKILIFSPLREDEDGAQYEYYRAIAVVHTFITLNMYIRAGGN